MDHLNDLEEKFKIFLDLSTDGYWDWDLLNPEYEYMSPRFKAILGYEDHELPNSPDAWKEKIHPEDLERVLENFEAHKRDPSIPYYNVVRYQHRNGEELHIICRGVMLRDENGVPYRMIGSHTDITPFKDKDSTLQMAKEKDIAIGREHASNIFLANMSHEIRTPLNGIIGLIDLIKTDISLGKVQFLEEHHTYLDTIYKSANTLLNLLGDILEYSNIKSNKLKMEYKNLKIKELKNDLFNRWNEDFKSKNINFKIRIIKGSIKEIKHDIMRLQQVLNIFLSNSLKYTKKGKVRLYINVDEENINFIISDTGIGMKKETIDKIFIPFECGPFNSKDIPGTGLGLCIAKKILNQIDATIEVDSTYGKGSEFVLKIPNKKTVSDFYNETSNENSDNKESDKRIKALIVEDNKINMYVIKEFSKKCNIRVDCASNGKDALKKLKSNHYDIAYLDVELPDINGNKIAQIIKEDFPNIFIVIVTANCMSGDRERYLKVSDYYIGKPILIENFKDSIEQYKKNQT